MFVSQSIVQWNKLHSMHFLVILAFLGTAQCANILGVFMYPSISHQVVFQQIWRELSLRGHQVTVVTPNPLDDPKLTNLTEINVQSAYQVLENTGSKVGNYRSYCQEMENYYQILDNIAENELNNSQFQQLISDSNKFDLVLIEILHPVMYALANRFEAPVIGVSSANIFSVQYDAVGNPNHPVLYPDPIFSFSSGELSLWQKFQSIYFFLWNKFYYHYIFVPRAHQMAQKYFGEDIPYIGDLERNVSLYFLNTNLVVHPARPNVPAIVEISPIDTQPPKPLSKELKRILDEAKEGVIYIDLGRNFSTVEKTMKILQAVSELPYKVLWKTQEDLLTIPRNVITRKWFPQKDLLAHPNVKVFITQPELYLVEAAIAAEVPLICVPFTTFQQPLSQRVVDLGIGSRLRIKGLTKIKVKNTIIKVVETKTYKKSMVEARDILFDTPMTGLENAVWWSEYVIRHNGAWHLRSPAIDMPWYEYLLLDVLLFLALMVFLCLYLLVQIYSWIPKLCRRMFRKEKAKKEKIN